jgi:hypothetical protein
MMSLRHGWGWQPTQTASRFHIRHNIKCLSILICCPYAYSSSFTQLHPHYLLWSDFGVLGHLWSQMMSLRHDWAWQPPQTASHIHIRHVYSVWAHWYAVHRHTLAALHNLTHTTYLAQILVFWVTCAVKMIVMVMDTVYVEWRRKNSCIRNGIFHLFRFIWSRGVNSTLVWCF